MPVPKPEQSELRAASGNEDASTRLLNEVQESRLTPSVFAQSAAETANLQHSGLLGSVELVSSRRQQRDRPNAEEYSAERPSTRERPADIGQERERLTRLLDRLPAADRERAQQDMVQFEQRAQGRIGTQEIAKTYQAASRILEAGSATLNNAARQEIAADVLRQAARPAPIQGHSNMCGFAVLESKMYTSSPASAARMVADVVATGRFVTEEGAVIRPDAQSIASRYSSASSAARLDERSHASQIFQVTAANIYLDHVNRETGSRFSYQQRSPAAGATGERLIDSSKNPPEVVRQNSFGIFAKDGESALSKVYSSISGRPEQVTTYSPAARLSEEQFRNSLMQQKVEGRLPAALIVNTLNQPYLGETGLNGATFHVVEVTDIDRDGNVSIRNPLRGLASERIPAATLNRQMYLPQMDAKNSVEFAEVIMRQVSEGTAPRARLHEVFVQLHPEDRRRTLAVQVPNYRNQRLMDLLTGEQLAMLGVGR